MSKKWLTGLNCITLCAVSIFWVACKPASSATPEPSVATKSITPKPASSDIAEDAETTQGLAKSRRSQEADAIRLQDIERGVSISNISEALQFLQSQENTDTVRALRGTLLRQWAAHDIRAAVKWVANMPPGESKTESLNTLAIAFANLDLMESIQWAWKLPEGPDRNSVIKHIGYEAAVKEPVTALTLAVGSLPDTQERDDLIHYGSLQWAAKDPLAAAAWASQIPDATLRERTLVHITTAWGETDPVSAASFALKQIPPGRSLNDALIAIVQRWVQHDPEAAANWVETFPDGPLFETAAENLRQLWPAKAK